LLSILDTEGDQRLTGLNPRKDYQRVFLHWHLSEECRIPGTAIEADLSRQTPATVPVTHYFDVKRVCRNCGRPFIFFAEEQKQWYQELGFPLEADAVRCPPCRKRLQQIARNRERYEQLFHLPARTLHETLEMADCCLTLIEEAVFYKRQMDRVRMLLNSVPEEKRSGQRYSNLVARLHIIETEANDGPSPL
jgi:Probable zinc-ribbon domain